MSIVALAVIALSQTSVPSRGKLVWSDEFLKDGAPDPALWTYEKGFLRNGEKQYYTENRRENSRVENGHLVIEARKDGFGGNEVTSASLTTSGRHEVLYGRVEVRAKVPTGRGTWPAIWMLGTNIGTAGWPMCGEIDIMENVGYDPEKMHFNAHTKAYNHAIGTNKSATIDTPKVWTGFHTYAIDWTPERLDWEFDGKRVFTYKKPENATIEQWPFDAPQYLILNLAIGGGWGGQKGIDDAIFPSRYEVDFVRVYAPK